MHGISAINASLMDILFAHNFAGEHVCRPVFEVRKWVENELVVNKN
jgi:hypothetical protein